MIDDLETASTTDVGNVVFIGAGPAGLAPLIWAARSGALPALAASGIMVVDAQEAPGAGQIADYAIDSDTAASTFLECLTDDAPRLAALRAHPATRRIAAYGNDAVPLSDIAVFLRLLGEATVATLRDHGIPVMTARAIASYRTRDGWSTLVKEGYTLRHFQSKAIVLATGATQADNHLDGVTIGRLALSTLGDRLLLSSEALGHRGLSAMRRRLAGRVTPRIVIVGGSHSALAAAWRVLHELPDVDLRDDSVTLLHRRPLRPFYPTPEAARADGYVDFDDDDICPVSGRLFRLAGFRFRARALVRAGLGIGNADPEPRLTFMPLSAATIPAAETRLAEADLVIAALGYRPRALPLFDEHGAPIALASGNTAAPLVNDRCEVQDAFGHRVPGVLALGLAAGFRPSGSLGGEASFSGQTNGLWLWQNGVGERIIRRLLEGASY